MNEKLNILNELISKIENTDLMKDNRYGFSFFEIIKRHYDEDLISRMLSYILKENDTLCKELINLYCIKKNIKLNEISFTKKDVICEKNMGGKRVDIFIVLSNKCGPRYTISIENKIFSTEHDNQTQKYFEWVMKNEKNSINTFFYLRPNFNNSIASCTNFESITYLDIKNLLSNSNNIYIEDFKQLIENKLKDKDIIFMDNELERFLLEHYKTIKDLVDEEAAKIKKFKNDFIFGLLGDKTESIPYKIIDTSLYDIKNKNVKDGYIDLDIADNDSVFRFYRFGHQGWYLKDNNKQKSYYFYVEIKFEQQQDSDMPLSKITYQMTIKKYDMRNECIVDKFIKDENIEYENIMYDCYYILESKQFICDKDILLSKEWIEELKYQTTNTLNKFIDKMDDIFKKFCEYKNSLTNEI